MFWWLSLLVHNISPLLPKLMLSLGSLVWTLQKNEARIRKRYIISAFCLFSNKFSYSPVVAVTFKNEAGVSRASSYLRRMSKTVYSFNCQCAVANVDADADENASLAQKYEIRSFPTLKFFPKDNKAGEDYKGGRSEADFVAFLNERCGTSRSVGGGLNDLVCSH